MSLSYHLFCVSTDGIPLFVQHSADMKEAPFALIGALNGVHMFGENHQVEVVSAKTGLSATQWKVFHSIKVILTVVNNQITADEMLYIMEKIFQAFVFVIGESNFISFPGIEVMKRKMHGCAFLVSNIMQQVCSPDYVTKTTPVVLVDDASLMKSHLDTFCEECDCRIAFLLLRDRVIAGTADFWELESLDVSLLVLYTFTIIHPNCQASDTPVFLPSASPKIPNRLVVIKLLSDLRVVMICGPQPSLFAILKRHVGKYWKPISSTLKSSLASTPRNFPPSIKFDKNVLSFLLVNRKTKKNWCSLHPQGGMTGGDQFFLAQAHARRDALVTFYKSHCMMCEGRDNKISAFYQNMEKCKCYAILGPVYELFVLYTVDLPTYAMKHVSDEVLKRLQREKFL